MNKNVVVAVTAGVVAVGVGAFLFIRNRRRRKNAEVEETQQAEVNTETTTEESSSSFGTFLESFIGESLRNDSTVESNVDDVIEMIDSNFDEYRDAVMMDADNGFATAENINKFSESLLNKAKESGKIFKPRDIELIILALNIKFAQGEKPDLFCPSFTTQQILEIISRDGFDPENPNHVKIFEPVTGVRA